ncbi:MAG: alpha/beta fold hydrolase [Pseudomonadota bacterium]
MAETLPAVFIPGLQSDATAWTAQMGAFDRTLVLPGGYHKAPSIEAMGRVIERDLPERFHLVGWSMGGYIALSMVERLARRVASLSVIATSARAEANAPRPGRAETVARARALGLLRHQEEVLRASFFEPARVDEPLPQAMIAAAERLGLRALEAQIAAIVERPDRRSLLPTLKVPTQVIVGEADNVTPPLLAEEIAAGIANATLHVIEAAGHCVPVEKPDAVNARLGRLFDRYDA